MEFVLLIGLCISLITNYVLIRKVTTPVEPIILEKVIERVVEKTPEEKPQVVIKKAVDDSQHAWSNKKNIPIGPNRPAQESSPQLPPKPGPLERPAGFYR